MHMWLNLLAHVIILMLHIQQGCAFPIFLIDCCNTLFHELLLLLVEVHVVVTDYI